MQKTVYLFILLSAILYLAGCGKDTTDHAIGTWSITTEHFVFRTDTVITKDTTAMALSGVAVLNLGANGHYTYSGFGIVVDSGTYIHSGNKLVLYDAEAPNGYWYDISRLDAHTMIEHRIDTLSYGPPLKTEEKTFTLSR